MLILMTGLLRSGPETHTPNKGGPRARGPRSYAFTRLYKRTAELRCWGFLGEDWWTHLAKSSCCAAVAANRLTTFETTSFVSDHDHVLFQAASGSVCGFWASTNALLRAKTLARHLDPKKQKYAWHVYVKSALPLDCAVEDKSRQCSELGDRKPLPPTKLTLDVLV